MVSCVYMIFQINEYCVKFKAPMKIKLCDKVPELISIKKEIYAVFMIILSMLRKRRTTLSHQHYCN